MINRFVLISALNYSVIAYPEIQLDMILFIRLIYHFCENKVVWNEIRN